MMKTTLTGLQTHQLRINSTAHKVSNSHQVPDMRRAEREHFLTPPHSKDGKCLLMALTRILDHRWLRRKCNRVLMMTGLKTHLIKVVVVKLILLTMHNSLPTATQ
jgi:hypothetical protein